MFIIGYTNLYLPVELSKNLSINSTVNLTKH